MWSSLWPSEYLDVADVKTLVQLLFDGEAAQAMQSTTVEEEQKIVSVVEATEEEPVPDISWPVVGDGWFHAPKEIAAQVVKISETKSRLGILSMLMLGMLAGVYVGFGADLCTMVTHDLSQHLGTGFTRFLGGSVFSVGLVLVILAGSELFTGNCLILMGVLSGKVTMKAMLRNWCVVYFANFAGSLLLVSIVYHSGLWEWPAPIGGTTCYVSPRASTAMTGS